jgi:predicted transcriptional regulator
VGALILTALALAYATYDMFSSARRFVDDVELRWDDANTELQERVDEAETLTGKLDQSDTDLRRQIDEVRSEMRRRLMPDEIRTNQISELKSELADLKEKLEKVMSSSANGGVRKQPGTE